ncbi:hypothetical protein AK812_SmicGene26630 [Symbiodinium microadriaticum]|uniref:Uncharacterized protein n=1 Tax=Symbiodinium microadriaticum TaxID=2951 RepID=A0A1Q9D911_SYMMI|nr:hypothetical protein AK812_SmicGene26630 [Symbiodinium microadriaticum]
MLISRKTMCDFSAINFTVTYCEGSHLTSELALPHVQAQADGADCSASEILRVPTGRASLVPPRLSFPAVGWISRSGRGATGGRPLPGLVPARVGEDLVQLRLRAAAPAKRKSVERGISALGSDCEEPGPSCDPGEASPAAPARRQRQEEPEAAQQEARLRKAVACEMREQGSAGAALEWPHLRRCAALARYYFPRSNSSSDAANARMAATAGIQSTRRPRPRWRRDAPIAHSRARVVRFAPLAAGNGLDGRAKASVSTRLRFAGPRDSAIAPLSPPPCVPSAAAFIVAGKRVCRLWSRIAPGMRGYARVCASMRGYARACAGMRDYARVCASMHEHAPAPLPDTARVPLPRTVVRVSGDLEELVECLGACAQPALVLRRERQAAEDIPDHKGTHTAIPRSQRDESTKALGGQEEVVGVVKHQTQVGQQQLLAGGMISKDIIEDLVRAEWRLASGDGGGDREGPGERLQRVDLLSGTQLGLRQAADQHAARGWPRWRRGVQQARYAALAEWHKDAIAGIQ